MMIPTKQQIETLARIFSECHVGYENEWEDLFLDETNVETTRTTIDEFVHNDWRECPAPEFTKIESGQSGLCFGSVQDAKGNQRVDIAIYDCGDFRIMYQQ